MPTFKLSGFFDQPIMVNHFTTYHQGSIGAVGNDVNFGNPFIAIQDGANLAKRITLGRQHVDISHITESIIKN